MADDKRTVGIGFSSGLATTLKLEQSELDKLLKAIEAEDKWVEVSEEKRSVTLRADRVDFYGLDEEKEERRTGF
jgi:hypothetical protein